MNLQQIRAKLQSTLPVLRQDRRDYKEQWLDKQPGRLYAATFHLNKAYWANRWIEVGYERTIRFFANRLRENVFTTRERRRGDKLIIFAVKQRNTSKNRESGKYGYHCHLLLGGFPERCDAIKAIEEAVHQTQCISKKPLLFNEESIKRIDEEYRNRWTGDCGLSGWTTYMVRQMESDDVLLEQPFQPIVNEVEKANNLVDMFFQM